MCMYIYIIDILCIEYLNVHTQWSMLFSHKNGGNPTIWNNMGGS